MKTNSLRGRGGFTLIELMAVIVIIVILATIVVGAMNYVQEKQAKEKARVQINLLAKAIEEYKLDMGKYPGKVDNTPADGSGVSSELYEALFYEGYTASESPNSSSGTSTTASKIYLPELDPTTSKLGWVTASTSSKPPATTKILDPWGNEYRYRKGTNAQNPDFDVWSCGKNGKTTANSAKLEGDNKDDIRNF